MYTIIMNILTLLGSLALLLFGMKLMSEALQKVAGARLRNTLAGLTANRYRSVISGFVVTALIQSSSATTVMIVSFVNAGLLSLVESIGLVMGANIGTTITAWLISLLGFNIKISSLALPLIGIGFPLIFSTNNTRKSWGEFIIGFALIFLGLDFLKLTIPDISTRPELIGFVSNYTHHGFFSILLFLSVGMLFTILIQSSSAAMALTLVMCYKGWIDFDLAAAMILGENIGTTVTANFAAIVANRMAKRSAVAHFLFNVIGVFWILLLFRPFLHGIDLIVQKTGNPSAFESVISIPVALSIFHTAFNLINTALLIEFIPQIQKLIYRLLPVREDRVEQFRLKHFRTGLLSTSELSILQAKKEIAVYARRVKKMFRMVRNLFNEINDEMFRSYFQRITNYEEICGRMELEISNYIMRISEGELSQPGTKRIRTMLKIVDEIESIGDICKNIADILNRKKQNKVWFPQHFRNNLNSLFALVDEAFDQMNKDLDKDFKEVDSDKALEIEKKIVQFKEDLEKEHLENSDKQDYREQAGVIYNDILVQSENLANSIFNVSDAIADANLVTDK